MKILLGIFVCMLCIRSSVALTVPGFTSGNTCSEGNNCTSRPGSDHVEPIIVNSAGYYRFDISGTQFAATMDLGTTACSNNLNPTMGTCGDQPIIACFFLSAGTYYLTLDCASAGCCGLWQVNVTSCTVASGETAANPIIIPSLPFNQNNSTNCHDNDVDNAGCTSGSSGPDLFYRFTPTTNNQVNITLQDQAFQFFYRRLIVDGVCYTGTGSTVSVNNYQMTSGVPINIVVDGCCGKGISYNLSLTEITPPPCVPFCDSYFQETETCGDGYVDTFNGGCDAAAPMYAAFGCSQNICGRSGTFVTAGQNRKDSDWYEMSFAQQATLYIYSRAEFAGQTFLYRRGDSGCADMQLINSAVYDACTQNQFTSVCEPGIYWIKIEPQATTGVPCNAKYLLQTSCGPGPCMRDYCSSPVSATIGVNFDSTFNSCCAQQNNAFIYPSACMGTQVASGNDIQIFLFPFSEDTVDIIAESDDGDVQISVQSGFNCNSVTFGCFASADLNGPGLPETISDLILPPNFYYVQTSLAGATACGDIRIRVLFGPEAPDAVEELVIYPVAPDIHLDWETISGAVQYKIYRSATTNVQVIPGNLIGTTAATDYVDAGVLNTSPEIYFYIVVAEN